jgi:hypothetical protein
MFSLDRHDGVTVCLLESHEHVEHLELSIEVARSRGREGRRELLQANHRYFTSLRVVLPDDD